MPSGSSEIFFRPDEIARERLTLPAALYNQCRLTLTRSGRDHIFVPIVALQMLSLIEHEEVIFVDNQAYAVRDGQGGKLIKLAWVFRHDQRGDHLDTPAPIELVYYTDNARELHNRLIGEFKKSLDMKDRRSRGKPIQSPGRKILPFSRNGG